MKFSCQAQVLMNGLSIVTRVLSSRTTQPILEGVLIRSTDTGLQLTCSDGAISVQTVIPAQIAEDGSVVMPGKLFQDIVRKMPQADIMVTTNEKYVTKLNCMGTRMTLTGQPGELYPALPLVSAENSFTIPQTILREMIQQTAFAIAVEDPRKVLNGCLLEIANGEARMVALDGFRLAMCLSRLSGNEPVLSAIIPGKAVSEMAHVLEDNEDKTATIMIGGNQMLMTFDNTRLYATLIEGEYINYRQILPTSWKTRVKFDRDQLARCVERCSLIAREGKNNLIKMQIEEDRIIITSNSENGEAYEDMNVEMEGDGLTIAFNVMYVSDILRVLPEGNFYMRFNSQVSPCVICPENGDEFLYLMLPVRVNA